MPQEGLTFGIILTIDGLKECDLRRFRPIGGSWRVTENKPDEYLLGLNRVKHRKYGAQLTHRETRDMIDRYCLRHDGEGTALGAPGTDYATSEAAVFLTSPVDRWDAWVEASITPLFKKGPVTKEMFMAAIAELKR